MNLLTYYSNFIFNSFNFFLSLSNKLKQQKQQQKQEKKFQEFSLQKECFSYHLLIKNYLSNLVSEDLSKECSNKELDQIDLLIDIINDIQQLFSALEIFIFNENEVIHIEVIQLLQVNFSFFLF